MNFVDKLRHAERLNQSMLCVGLDPEPAKFPGAWKGDNQRIFDFCAQIVDATRDLVIAFKPQKMRWNGSSRTSARQRLMCR